MVFLKTFRVLKSSVLYNAHYNLARFFVARLEAPLIALALFLVQVNLLGEMALERYLLSWLGVVVLMWTARTIIKVDEARSIYRKILAVVRCPGLRAAQSRSGGLFVDFLADFLLVVVALLILRGNADLTIMLLSAVLVVATQAAINLSIFITHLYLSKWVNIKNVLAGAFIFFVIMSPVFFMFNDLDRFGSKYFTSFNPAAHFLAAYYNIFWFREPMSLQVIPVFLVLSIVFVLSYCLWIEARAERRLTEHLGTAQGRNTILLGRFVERGSITGLELWFSFYALGPHPMDQMLPRVQKLLAMTELKDQFRRSLSTYSRQNDLYLDLLLAACLADQEETLVSLPDEEIPHVTESHFEDVLEKINVIMGTQLLMAGSPSQRLEETAP